MWKRFWQRGSAFGLHPKAGVSVPTSQQGIGCPTLPPGIRVYAVGDIHGRADLLDRILASIDYHRGTSPPALCIEVFLGDYIDRGPDSRGVIARLSARESEQHPRRQIVALAGNHEAILCEVLERPERLDFWARIGGLETLMSYGIAVPTRIEAAASKSLVDELRVRMPLAHRLFLSRLNDSFACGDYFFVHAGVRPGVPLNRQDRADLLWIRGDFISSKADHGAVVVHGHTPVTKVETHSNRINLDTGAYITNTLSCLVLESQSRAIIS